MVKEKSAIKQIKRKERLVKDCWLQQIFFIDNDLIKKAQGTDSWTKSSPLNPLFRQDQEDRSKNGEGVRG